MKDNVIIFSHYLHKGLIAVESKMGGYDLLIVSLSNKYDTGADFPLEAVRKIDAVLHFCDRESVEQTAKGLEFILKRWKEEE